MHKTVIFEAPSLVRFICPVDVNKLRQLLSLKKILHVELRNLIVMVSVPFPFINARVNTSTEI